MSYPCASCYYRHGGCPIKDPNYIPIDECKQYRMGKCFFL